MEVSTRINPLEKKTEETTHIVVSSIAIGNGFDLSLLIFLSCKATKLRPICKSGTQNPFCVPLDVAKQYIFGGGGGSRTHRPKACQPESLRAQSLL